MQFEDLSEEQKAKARECKTPEELMEMAREEGYELSAEELEAINGGWFDGANCMKDFDF